MDSIKDAFMLINNILEEFPRMRLDPLSFVEGHLGMSRALAHFQSELMGAVPASLNVPIDNAAPFRAAVPLLDFLHHLRGTFVEPGSESTFGDRILINSIAIPAAATFNERTMPSMDAGVLIRYLNRVIHGFSTEGGDEGGESVAYDSLMQAIEFLHYQSWEISEMDSPAPEVLFGREDLCPDLSKVFTRAASFFSTKGILVPGRFMVTMVRKVCLKPLNAFARFQHYHFLHVDPEWLKDSPKRKTLRLPFDSNGRVKISEACQILEKLETGCLRGEVELARPSREVKSRGQKRSLFLLSR